MEKIIGAKGQRVFKEKIYLPETECAQHRAHMGVLERPPRGQTLLDSDTRLKSGL